MRAVRCHPVDSCGIGIKQGTREYATFPTICLNVCGSSCREWYMLACSGMVSELHVAADLRETTVPSSVI